MHNPTNTRIFLFFLLSALLRVSHSIVDYSEMKALGISCPERDSCAGYIHDSSYMDRNCECDFACSSYGDCCIDSFWRLSQLRNSLRTDFVCLNYGEGYHTGIYVMDHCIPGWTGPQQIVQNCEGSLDLSDPLKSAPVIDIDQAVTYKNVFCAECNNVLMQSLKTFNIKVSCDGLDGISQGQIMGDLFYDQQRGSWGVNRLDAQSNTNFVECVIFYDLPDNLNMSVRFCRANVISTCARDWTDLQVAAKCEEYMAVVYDEVQAYRNPHCAICNHKAVSSVACQTSPSVRNRQLPLSVLFDLNQNGGNRCPPSQAYDPFTQTCRQVGCIYPGYVIVDGRCVPAG